MAKAADNFATFEDWRNSLPTEAVSFIDEASTDKISNLRDLFPLLVRFTNKLVIENRMLKAAMASTLADVDNDLTQQSFTDSSFSDAEDIPDSDDQTIDSSIISITDPGLVAPEVGDAGVIAGSSGVSSSQEHRPQLV